jgi:hypothetical protein
MRGRARSTAALRSGSEVKAAQGNSMAKCPKCDSMFSSANLEPIQLNQPRQKWKGVAYNCPSCATAISISIDPLAIRNEIITDVVAEIKKLLR